MKKLLSLSLAIVMMLSCMLGQAVLVNAAASDAVDYTNAPYAGVYAVTSNVDTTVTTEIGAVTELTAGVTGYTYLIAGANEVAVTNDAALTITELDNNGMDYIGNITVPTQPIISGQEDVVAQVPAGSTLVSIASGESYTFTYTAAKNGFVYPYFFFNSTPLATTLNISFDNGIQTTLYKGPYHTAGWAWESADQSDPAVAYVRAGENTVTVKNVGEGEANIYDIRIHSAGELATAWAAQLKVTELDVVPYTGEEPEPTEEPVPTEEPTPAPTEEPASNVVTYTAPLAGVYEVSSDADVTITNETGSTAALTVGDTKYIYLIKGVNNITTTNTEANLTFTQLEDNGMSYFDQIVTDYTCYGEEHVTADLHAVVSSKGYYDIGTNANGAYISMSPGTEVTYAVTMSADGAGIIYPWLGFAECMNENTFRITTDTGFYTDIYKPAKNGSYGWTDATNQELAFLYVREGVNYITIKNTGSNNALISSFRISMTDGSDSIVSTQWGSQINLKSLNPVAAVLSAEGVNTAAGELTFYGKVGAQYLDQSYGVIVSGKSFYGAKDGDTVSDGAEGTTTFTFGGWDGTFDIILTNITEKGTAGEKTYQFFVGDYVTDEAVVTVE